MPQFIDKTITKTIYDLQQKYDQKYERTGAKFAKIEDIKCRGLTNNNEPC